MELFLSTYEVDVQVSHRVPPKYRRKAIYNQLKVIRYNKLRKLKKT